MPTGQTYHHDPETHGAAAVDGLAEVIHLMFNPDSVVDVGCGTGNLLAAMKQRGCRRVLGIDGSWVPEHLRKSFLLDDEFIEHNLETVFTTEKRFDLAVCLEVAEHLDERSANALVETLTGLSTKIIFSAAVPGQDGDGHVNCQWPDYWASRFRDRGYATSDVIRPKIAALKAIPWWYRQNIFFAWQSNSEKLDIEMMPNIPEIVVVECYQSLLQRFDNSEEKRKKNRGSRLIRIAARLLGVQL